MQVETKRIEHICSVVSQITGVSQKDLHRGLHCQGIHTNARALFVMILKEEGMKQIDIARAIGIERSIITRRLQRAEVLLGYDKTTKKNYLKIIQIIENED